MKAFRTLTSHAVLLPVANIDTDQIIPASFLKGTRREGLGRGLFAGWRYDPSGAPRPDFALNRPEAVGARILVAGENFGCGSSREHAVWALADEGIEVVVASRFADIFKSNALKNGLLPAQLPADAVAELVAALTTDPRAELTVDLEASTVTLPSGRVVPFPIDPFSRHCLLEGQDPLDYLLAQRDAITAFEAARPAPIDTLQEVLHG